MDSTMKNPRNRRLAGAGVAGLLIVALGVGMAGPAFAGTDAAMVQTTSTAVTDAVSAAQAEAAAAQAHAEQVAAQQQAVVDLAMAQEGDPYSMGASGPNVFDCSGLVMYVYENALGVSLPHNTHAQWNAIEDTWYVGEKEPQPGDVVFFFNNGADHVGIYIGDGMMINAQNGGVQVEPIYSGYWAPYLTGFGRVIH